jgi:rubrerythrin
MSTPSAAFRALSERGADGRVEVRCCGCGYGAVVARLPARCPMCGRGAWRPAAGYALGVQR